VSRIVQQLNIDEGDASGELVIVSFAIPLPVYKLISEVARQMGTSTNKFLLHGFSWFMSKIEEAGELPKHKGG